MTIFIHKWRVDKTFPTIHSIFSLFFLFLSLPLDFFADGLPGYDGVVGPPGTTGKPGDAGTPGQKGEKVRIIFDT